MPTPLQRRVMLWTPAAVLLAGALAWLFRPLPVSVDLATVERGALQVAISDEGEARLREVFIVSAPLAGLMRRVELEAGDVVVANETLIAQLEPAVPMFLDERSAAEAKAAADAAAAARNFAAAQYRRAIAESEFAASELQRLRALATLQNVSRNELDAAERRAKTATAAVAEAQAGIKMRESEYQQMRARLRNPREAKARARDCDCILVRAPISGTVLRVHQQSEATVAAGTPIIEIGDPQKLEIHVDLLSEEAVNVRSGQRAYIERWGGADTLNGIVRRVEPIAYTKVSALGVEEQRVNVIIDLTDSPQRWLRLGHGYKVEPHIVVWESNDVVQVPLSALFRDGERWAVFVAAEGRAALREVQCGQRNGVRAEIQSGLAVGESIVLHPNERIANGSRIVARISE